MAHRHPPGGTGGAFSLHPTLFHDSMAHLGGKSLCILTVQGNFVLFDPKKTSTERFQNRRSKPSWLSMEQQEPQTELPNSTLPCSRFIPSTSSATMLTPKNLYTLETSPVLRFLSPMKTPTHIFQPRMQTATSPFSLVPFLSLPLVCLEVTLLSDASSFSLLWASPAHHKHQHFLIAGSQQRFKR